MFGLGGHPASATVVERRDHTVKWDRHDPLLRQQDAPARTAAADPDPE